MKPRSTKKQSPFESDHIRQGAHANCQVPQQFGQKIEAAHAFFVSKHVATPKNVRCLTLRDLK
jgi:hypothetical protein